MAGDENKVKATNPKDALGIKKVPFHCIPMKTMAEVGLAMMEGGRKYGAHNYRVEGVLMSTYMDSTVRHLVDWWEGEDIDPDSGVHHLVKAIAGLFVLRDAMHMNNCVDDRPVRYPGGLNMVEFNKIAADIIERYPNCVDPYTEVGKDERSAPTPTPCDICTDDRRYDSYWCMRHCQIEGAHRQ